MREVQVMYEGRGRFFWDPWEEIIHMYESTHLAEDATARALHEINPFRDAPEQHPIDPRIEERMLLRAFGFDPDEES